MKQRNLKNNDFEKQAMGNELGDWKGFAYNQNMYTKDEALISVAEDIKRTEGTDFINYYDPIQTIVRFGNYLGNMEWHIPDISIKEPQHKSDVKVWLIKYIHGERIEKNE